MSAKPNIFGSKSAARAVAFESKAQEFDDWSVRDNIGAHVLFTVKGVERVETRFGLKDAVRHDVAVYNKRGEVTEVAADILTFSAAIVRDLADYTGQQVFAKIGSYTSKKYGKTAPCVEEPEGDYLDAYIKATT